MAPRPNHSYTHEEKENIVKFIIKNNGYYDTKGVTIWKQMEAAQICPGRSWQSLKEQFRKTILKNLGSINISLDEKEQIMNGYNRNFVISKRHVIESSSSDDEDVFNKRKQIRVTESQQQEKTNSNKIQMSIEACVMPYSEMDDNNIITYFKDNLNLLNRKNETSVYERLKTKYKFQKSVKSLQERFLNVILPHVYKYKVLDVSETIQFYDNANLEVPEDFLKTLNEEFNKNNSSTENSNTIKTPNILTPPSPVIASNLIRSKKTMKDVGIQFDFDELIQIEKHLDCIQVTLDSVKHIFIPPTTVDVATIQDQFATKYGITKDHIHIVSTMKYNSSLNFMNLNEKIEKWFVHNLKKIYDKNYVRRMKKNIRTRSRHAKLLHIPISNTSSTGFNKTIDQGKSVTQNENENNSVVATPEVLTENIVIDSIVNALFMDVDDSSAQIKSEPQDDTEIVIRSPYFQDHSYSQQLSIPLDVVRAEATSSNYNNNNNKTGIMLSKRSLQKIKSENLNIDHLKIPFNPIDDQIPEPESDHNSSEELFK